MGNAEHNNITDYAMPLIRLEALLRKVHDLCLRKEYIVANEACPEIIAEARMLSATLVLMDAEKQRGYTA